MSAIRLSIPENAKAGDIVEIKAMIRHDMESGYRRDIQGKPIPRLILTNFECRLEDDLVFSADIHPGISANPLLKFFLRAEKSGILTFTWTEQTGQVFTKSAELLVT